jgi:CRP-like cAMP-binding protein
MLPLVRWRASAAADGLVAFASTPPETVLGHPARHCSLFQHLSEQDWRTILEAARVRSAAKGSLYFRQGEPATAVYILIRGQVKLVRLAPDGRQVFVRLVVRVENG